MEQLIFSFSSSFFFPLHSLPWFPDQHLAARAVLGMKPHGGLFWPKLYFEQPGPLFLKLIYERQSKTPWLIDLGILMYYKSFKLSFLKSAATVLQSLMWWAMVVVLDLNLASFSLPVFHDYYWIEALKQWSSFKLRWLAHTAAAESREWPKQISFKKLCKRNIKPYQSMLQKNSHNNVKEKKARWIWTVFLGMCGSTRYEC